MKMKKDLRNSSLISGGAVEIYEFLEIFLKNRMDRCQLVSVNITEFLSSMVILVKSFLTR